MVQALLISIKLYDGRYHGAGEWPPAPARLFQALVAGAGLSGPLDDRHRDALEWLERLDAPVIAAPRQRESRGVTLYVPNNDLDSVGGDPRYVAKIRGSRKVFKPRHFAATIPFIYVWTFEESEESERNAGTVSQLAERLYQFGRGVDFACAWAEQLSKEALEQRVSSYPGTLHRPSPNGRGLALKCPAKGSFKSLDDRYRAYGRRFRVEPLGRTIKQVFTKAPSPRFTLTAYDSPSLHYIFELREHSDEARFATWPMAQIARLVELLRDGATARLCSALPSRRTEIERVIIGRKSDGSNDGPAVDRVRILPLPSVGHYHADRSIRRVLIEVPPNCPLLADDMQWALSGLRLSDANSQNLQVIDIIPAAADAEGMLSHYGIAGDEGYRRWRTVTPAALPNRLPGAASHRRIRWGRRRTAGSVARSVSAPPVLWSRPCVTRGSRWELRQFGSSGSLSRRKVSESRHSQAEHVLRSTGFGMWRSNSPAKSLGR